MKKNVLVHNNSTQPLEASPIAISSDFDGVSLWTKARFWRGVVPIA